MHELEIYFDWKLLVFVLHSPNTCCDLSSEKKCKLALIEFNHNARSLISSFEPNSVQSALPSRSLAFGSSDCDLLEYLINRVYIRVESEQLYFCLLI